jgi:hypothetical protein
VLSPYGSSLAVSSLEVTTTTELTSKKLNEEDSMRRTLALALVLFAGLAPSAFSQIATGDIFGIVQDESGAVLPGATVTLTGPAGSRTTTAGNEGSFRFLNLPFGTYTLHVALAGFASVERAVIVTTGQNVSLTFNLKVAAQAETITVTAETPVVDTKRVGTTTTLTDTELKSTPQARDPWAVLRTIPGVFVDRVNVAGSESGQQANFQGKGASIFDNSFVIEGVDITDQGAPGSSPGYYDYDSFAEIAVSTGGADFVQQTGGVNINFVTKRGTNRWRGSARGYLTHDDFSSSNLKGTALENDERLQGNDKANHVQQINDYGFEFGGPILKDKLFIWGSYGKQDIRLVTFNQTQDKTILEGFNGKLNWEVTPNTSFSAFWFQGKKTKIGRDIGDPIGGIQQTEQTVVDQGDRLSDDTLLGVPGLLKFELNHVFSPNFMVDVRYSNNDSGFGLDSRNFDSSATLDYENGTARGGSWIQFGSIRPLKHITNVDGNYFASGWGGQHNLKFGFGYKKSEVISTTSFGGSPGLLGFQYGSGPDDSVVWVTRSSNTGLNTDFYDAYLGDVFTKDRLTITAGLRWDYQTFENAPLPVPANPTFPELLPSLEPDPSAKIGNGITWNEISPRVGITYSLDEAAKTVARASFARYSGRIDSYYGKLENPAAYAFLAYYWDDLNADGLPQGDEVRFSDGIQYYSNVDPENPGAFASSPNVIDENYSAPIDYEVIVGLDREIVPDLAVSAAYTWRRNTNVGNWDTRIGMTSADYTPNDPVTENGFTAQTYSPDPDLVAASSSGFIKSNRPDYHATYNGFEVSLFKRHSNGWMARAAFTYATHREYLTGPGAVQNPTRTDVSGGPGNLSGPQVNGGIVAPRSAGSGKGDIFYAARWQLTANALYELPAGFEIAGALYARDGYPRPIIITTPAGGDGNVRAMAISKLDGEKYPDLWNVDFRLAKKFRFGEDRNLTFSAELFNAFNSNTVLNRNRNAGSGVFNRVDEILAPRIARFGVTVDF